MRAATFAMALLAVGSSFVPVNQVRAADPNTLTDEEKQAGFEALPLDRGISGWAPTPGYRGNWSIDDGAIRLIDGAGPTYVAKNLPENFELRFEWKETKTADLNGRFQLTLSKWWGGGVQEHNGDSAEAKCGFQAGGRWICMSTGEVNLMNGGEGIINGFHTIERGGDSQRSRPPGEWNSGRVFHQGSIFQSWVDGRKVAEYDSDKEPFSEDPRMNGWKNLQSRGLYIRIADGIPAVGGAGWYRGFKLRTLDKGEVLDRTPIRTDILPVHTRPPRAFNGN
jgi:hypothetical protein